MLRAEGQCGLGEVGLTCRGNARPWLYSLEPALQWGTLGCLL